MQAHQSKRPATPRAVPGTIGGILLLGGCVTAAGVAAQDADPRSSEPVASLGYLDIPATGIVLLAATFAVGIGVAAYRALSDGSRPRDEARVEGDDPDDLSKVGG